MRLNGRVIFAVLNLLGVPDASYSLKLVEVHALFFVIAESEQSALPARRTLW